VPPKQLLEKLETAGDRQLMQRSSVADTSDSGIGVSIPARATWARLGVLVGYREMRRLLHLVGVGGASEILLAAKIIEAQEALKLGLVTRVVAPAALEGEVYDTAGDIARMAPMIHRWHKLIMRTVLANPGLAGLTPDQESLPFACFDTEDFQEGRRAFLEKRLPVFRGR